MTKNTEELIEEVEVAVLPEQDAALEESDDKVVEDAIEPEAPDVPDVPDVPADAASDTPAVEAAEPIAPSIAEELDSLVATFGKEKAELTASLNIAAERIEKLEALAEEREAVIAAQESDIAKASESVAAIKAKLANPAFNDAVDGEVEAAEDGAVEVEGASILDQLMAITDPKEKSKFRREHAEEITDAQRELAGK